MNATETVITSIFIYRDREGSIGKLPVGFDVPLNSHVDDLRIKVAQASTGKVEYISLWKVSFPAVDT